MNEKKREHNHVAVPKFIEKGFSTNDRVFVYNKKNDKVYQSSIDRVGVQNSYYDQRVEALLQEQENRVAPIIARIINANNVEQKQDMVMESKEIISRFLNLMLLRSKGMFELFLHSFAKEMTIEEKRKLCSWFLEALCCNKKIDIFTMMSQCYEIHIVENRCNDVHFINNSIGLSLKLNKLGKLISVYCPLSSNFMLQVKEAHYSDYGCYFYTEQNNHINEVNKSICLTENKAGYGFIFANDKVSVETYKVFCKN